MAVITSTRTYETLSPTSQHERLVNTTGESIFAQAVGFSGSRSPHVAQSNTLTIQRILDTLADAPVLVIVTGGCVGVDALVARLAHTHPSKRFHVHTILPDNRSKVDPQWEDFCTTHEQAPTYKQRNMRIVELATRLFAFPELPEFHPYAQRSGTWQTIRLARRKGIPVEIPNYP